MKLSGVLAPIPTPFDNADRLDTARLRKALQRWLKSALSGFVILGSTGEAVLMDDAESSRVIEAARDVVPKKRAFIVGTGRESTRSAVLAAKRAGKEFADHNVVGVVLNGISSELSPYSQYYYPSYGAENKAEGKN